MKKIAFALLVFIACTREPAQDAGPDSALPSQTTAPETSATTPPERQAEARPPSAEGPKLAFVDEASNDPSFAEYRTQLLAAVRARDKDKLLSLSDPNIRTSFGGDGGADDLEKRLSEDFWNELETVLTLGGNFREGMFWAPYVYSAWPESHDAFETFAVIADDVPLRESADTNAPVIATLSRNLVASRVGEGAWQKVTLADGRSGFVEAKFLRSPVDYRAGFSKGANGWRMTAFVAGD